MTSKNTFEEINNMKQRVYRLNYYLLSHPVVFTSNVQCVRLAAGRRALFCYKNRFVFTCYFTNTGILQGSVATRLRCGWIFGDSIITNVLLIQLNKFENLSIFDEVKAYITKCHFLSHPVVCKERLKRRLVDVESVNLLIISNSKTCAKTVALKTF